MKIPLKEGGSLPLYGRIDRLDVSPQEGLFRIVDYKMGDKKFDPAAMEAGLTLQLPLYLAAAGEKGAPAGMYAPVPPCPKGGRGTLSCAAGRDL